MELYELAKALKIDLKALEEEIQQKRHQLGFYTARDAVLTNSILNRIAELVEKVEINESRNIKTSN